MKLSELTSGTYVAVVPLPATLALLKEWARVARVPIDDKLHVTLLFSDVPVKVTLSSVEHVAVPAGFDIYNGCLVVKLDCPSMHARHEEFIAQGGTHDYSHFSPHLTITEKAAGIDVAQLEPIGFSMQFGMEYTEPLARREL